MDGSPNRSSGARSATPPGATAATAALRAAVEHHIRHTLALEPSQCTAEHVMGAVARALRDRLAAALLDTELRQAAAKRVYYLSMEFLIGRSLESNLLALGLLQPCQELVRALGHDFNKVLGVERDAALGNGGLGRLAACFLDSLATLDLPGVGYGINYEFGLFRQEIRGGAQVERPDVWNVPRSPWLIERPGFRVAVPLYGRVEHARDRQGNYNPMWLDWQVVIGVADDLPVVGYGGHTVNALRLFSARASDEFDIEIFNAGDYVRAVERKIASETISKLLYPSDSVEAGKELRLVQEYFLVACAVRDIQRRFEATGLPLERLAERAAIQLNDTHPALTVAELMRLLVDEKALPWERAWEITRAVCAYTNHTLLPEALERWPVALFERVLPRHLQLIYEINRRFLEQLELDRGPDDARAARVSIIEEGPPKQVRMAHLAIVGSHSVNGVAALHTRLLQETLVPDFAAAFPARFNNKTNGITPRRWLLQANPALAALLSEAIGTGWIRDLEQLRRLEPLADDDGFLDGLQRAKAANKQRLAELVAHSGGPRLDPRSLFDVQAKRIHEYKRQLLNLLHVVHRYLEIVDEGRTPQVPRTVIFAGKAAPGYWAAKQVIRLVHRVAETINHDPRVSEWLRVVFLPDYRVTLAERLIPAADLSEQISTAGTEASGTGNMKFALNGALTIGTLDGANIEIAAAVGQENILIFGLTAEQVQELLAGPAGDPRVLYERGGPARRVVDALVTGRLGHLDEALVGWLRQRLVDRRDPYCHLADLEPYVAAQQRADRWFGASRDWLRRAALNVSRIGRFSADRTINQYAEEIWGISPAR